MLSQLRLHNVQTLLLQKVEVKLEVVVRNHGLKKVAVALVLVHVVLLSLWVVLIVKSLLDENTFLAFDNLSSTYVIESNELNAYLAANYRSIVIEKAVWENLVGEAK
jgi:ribosomal protein L4